jgi:hypothetical protein
MNIPVVAINLYSVPAGKEELFLMTWEQLKEAIIDNPGFIRGRLHRSLRPDASFNYINVVEWENSLYSQGYKYNVELIQARLTEFGVKTTPELFEVVSEYEQLHPK